MFSAARQKSQVNSTFLRLIPFTDKTAIPLSAKLINTSVAQSIFVPK